jgi:hypothetical protein
VAAKRCDHPRWSEEEEGEDSEDEDEAVRMRFMGPNRIEAGYILIYILIYKDISLYYLS